MNVKLEPVLIGNCQGRPTMNAASRGWSPGNNDDQSRTEEPTADDSDVGTYRRYRRAFGIRATVDGETGLAERRRCAVTNGYAHRRSQGLQGTSFRRMTAFRQPST